MDHYQSIKEDGTPAMPASSDRLREIADQLFFVVGCGRSGTSLLQVMISNHPQIAMPSETGFYPLIRQRYLKRWGEIGTSSSFRRAFRSTMDFWRIKALELDEDVVWQYCENAEPSWETLFLAILAAVADKRGKPRIGEKSPGHLHYLDVLGQRFPRARFIHVVRDPRAVYLSQKKTHFGTRFVGAHCRLWEKTVAVHRKHSEALGPKRYLLVKYEDLVCEPEETMRSVCQFLGASYSETMLQHHKRDDLGFAKEQQGHMANTLRPVFTSSIDKWKKGLSRNQVGLIEQRLGRDMEFMGYPLSGAKTYLPAIRYRTDIALSFLERALRKVGRQIGIRPST